MGDGDLSTEAKMEILWREYTNKGQGGASRETLVKGIPDKVLIYALIGLNALGLGPDVLTNLLKGLGQ